VSRSKKPKFAILAVASATALSPMVAPASATSYLATVLQDVGGQGYSDAYGINISNEVVGVSLLNSDTSARDAVLWSPNGTPTILQDVGGQRQSTALGINSAGDIVGYSRPARAMVARFRVMTLLSGRQMERPQSCKTSADKGKASPLGSTRRVTRLATHTRALTTVCRASTQSCGRRAERRQCCRTQEDTGTALRKGSTTRDTLSATLLRRPPSDGLRHLVECRL
jgi:uncharacterized membrane protein